MSLTAITLRNWRAFKEQRIELRPLTLIYGDNNAGKSALLRAVVALCEASGEEGLNWEGEALKEVGFRELVRQNVPAGEDAELGWTLHHGASWLDMTARWVDPWRSSVVSRVACEDGRSIVWGGRLEEREARERSYLDEAGRTQRVVVDGHTVSLRDEPPGLRQLGWLPVLLGEHQWLRAGRKVPKIEESTKRLRPSLGVDGGGALALLDHVPQVLEFVQRHFARVTTPAGAEHGYALELERVLPDEMFLRLNATLVSAGRRVNVAQLGDGVQGVIPVLTALGWVAAAHDAAPELLAVEEPESQLHPTSQRALGEAVCDALCLIKARGLSRKLVVETHSDVLLMTVQLAIARGELTPQDVAIYWVKQDMETGVSAARLVDVHTNGTLGGLPRAAFREKIDLSGELLNAIPAVGAISHNEVQREDDEVRRR